MLLLNNSPFVCACVCVSSWLKVFFFHHFRYIMPLPLAYKISAEISADSLMRVPFHIIDCFSLAAFRIQYLTKIKIGDCFRWLDNQMCYSTPDRRYRRWQISLAQGSHLLMV